VDTVKVNIKKLSELSGYSPATISNALHNRRGVSQQTAAKVWKLARKAGYKVKNNITNIKLVTYSDSGEVFSDSPFFTHAFGRRVENEARRCGYDTTIYNLYRRQPDYHQKLQQLLTDPASAILLLGTELSEEDAPPFLKAQSPLVLLDCSFDKL
jgi:DNA-binding LacI/PurR family transcriptional regulator